MFESMLILVSLLFGILSIRYLRSLDVHEQEPFSKMLSVTICGGMVSVGLSLFLYRLLGYSGVAQGTGRLTSFLYVGFIEELAKLFALFLCWPFIRKEMDEPTDGLIYIACVALGFSLIENHAYALAHPEINALIAIRLIICTPMHIAFSLFMGLAFFWAVRFKGGWGALPGAYVVAGIYHAFYDIFVSYWFLLPGLYLILKSAYRWMYRLLGYTAANSPFRESLTAFIHSCESPAIEPGFKCMECTNGAPKPTYQRGRIRIQRCEDCGTYLCSNATLRDLVHHYGSLFGSLRRYAKRLPGRKSCRVLIGGNRMDLRQHTACFQLDEFNQVLERTSHDLSRQLEGKWWFPFRTDRADQA